MAVSIQIVQRKQNRGHELTRTINLYYTVKGFLCFEQIMCPEKRLIHYLRSQ